MHAICIMHITCLLNTGNLFPAMFRKTLVIPGPPYYRPGAYKKIGLRPVWKFYSDQVCSHPRDWRLSASWVPNYGLPETPQTSRQYGIERFNGALELSPIMPSEGSFSGSRFGFLSVSNASLTRNEVSWSFKINGNFRHNLIAIYDLSATWFCSSFRSMLTTLKIAESQWSYRRRVE